MKTTKKVFMIVAVACIVAVIATATAIRKIASTDKLGEAISLGNQYLSEMNYDMAIRSYTEALAINPVDKNALHGLAKSYAGAGETEKAKDIYRNELSETTDIIILEDYTDLLEQEKDYIDLIIELDKLIELEDDDKYYDKKEQIITQLLSQHDRHDYSESGTLAISLAGGAVNTRGSNMLGQLGTETALRDTRVSENFTPVAFPATPAKVYAWPNITAVIDDNGSVWMTGNNRASQRGDGMAEIMPDGQWTQVTGVSGIVKLAGTSTTTFALDGMGRVWYTGEGYGETWTDTWRLYDTQSRYLDIECNNGTLSMLTADGRLFTREIWTTYSSQDYELGTDAVMFSQDDYHVWLDSDGIIYTDYYGMDFPQRWKISEDSDLMRPDMTVRDIAFVYTNGTALYILDDAGTLHRISDGRAAPITTVSGVQSIYSCRGKCVVLTESGYALLDANGNIV
ncbi:MAG: hypothetical protein IJ410_08015 [Oscillospiraceae bacterium]|nr:hypothetical protein [Oscillospiraceae bacterium]